MTDSKQAWDRAGQDLADLGHRVKQHYEQQAGAEQPAPADRRKVEDALRQLADSLDQAFTALGDAIRDPEVGAHTKKAATSLSDALASTFAEVGERLRSKPDREQHGASGGPAGDV